MYHKVIGIAVVVVMAVSVGVGADCWNKVDAPCGGAPVNCSNYCAESLSQCQAAEASEAVRDYEDCVEPGVSWVNCDDRETPKLNCRALYACTAITTVECPIDPDLNLCSTQGAQIGYTI